MVNVEHSKLQQQIESSLDDLMGDPRRIAHPENIPQGEGPICLKDDEGYVLAELKTMSDGGKPPLPLVVVKLHPSSTLLGEILNYHYRDGHVVHSPSVGETGHRGIDAQAYLGRKLLELAYHSDLPDFTVPDHP